MSDALIYGRVISPRWRAMHSIAHGQQGLLDQQQHVVYYHLREAFRTAARQFGWEKQAEGIGINVTFAQWAQGQGLKVRVFVEGFNSRCYETDPANWVFADYRWLAKETWLYELPWSEAYFKTVTAIDDESIAEAWRILQLIEARKI